MAGSVQSAAEASAERGYGPRAPMPGLRLFHGVVQSLPDFAKPAFVEIEAAFEEPFVGLTTDGVARPGLTAAPADGVATQPIVDAAQAFLAKLTRPDLREQVLQPLASVHRRRWLNAFPSWMPPGMLLDDARPEEQEAVMAIAEASLSPEGYAEMRKVMRLNGLLGEFVDTYEDSLREYTYFFTIFGEPSTDAPWAWQIMGHHLDLNCTVLPDRTVLTPMFMGSEFNNVEGVTVFEEVADRGLDLIRSLSEDQQQTAVLYWTMNLAELPPEIGGPIDGRHRGGAGRDNLVVDYEGIAAQALDEGQRAALLGLIETYLQRLPEGHRRQRMQEVRNHLDELHFAWIGDPKQGAPFYYRIHSPVIWIEFDHHQGIFLDNDEPEPYHVHTIIRTPNGGDYGADLAPLEDGN